MSYLKKLQNSFEVPIETMQVCCYPVVSDMYSFLSLSKSKQKLADLLHKGMKNDLLYGAETVFDIPFFKKTEYNDYYSRLGLTQVLEVAKIVTDETLKKIDSLAEKNSMLGYFLVDVTRSSKAGIKPGTYLCSFDDLDNLLLLKAPFISYSLPTNASAAIFDYRLIQPQVKIEKSSIKDFQTFGTQLMQSTVSGETTPGNVGILATGLSEMVFGVSYTILKGMSKFSVNTKHEINDIRIVQVVFSDKSDLEFKGITVFYEFNRRMGNIKNKEVEVDVPPKTVLDSTPINKNANSISYIQELKDLKELLDAGILTEQEFTEKKKDILAKK